MRTAVLTERIAEASPRPSARITGVVYLLYFLTAVFGAFFPVMLLLYDIFKPVNSGLSLLAASFAFVGLIFEALRWQPQGVNIAIVFTGFYCLLNGYLIFRSTFLPRTLGALMAFAGLGWLTHLSNPLVNYLSPYNLASGLLAEVSVFLWLLVMCRNLQRWKEQASAAAGWRSTPVS